MIYLSIDLPVIKCCVWFKRQANNINLTCLLDTTYLKRCKCTDKKKNSILIFNYFFLNFYVFDLIFRLAVQCVWTAWKTWSSCAATAHVRCVVTGWRSAPYVGRRWKSGSFCISDSENSDPSVFCISDGGNADPSVLVTVEKRLYYWWWKSKFFHISRVEFLAEGEISHGWHYLCDWHYFMVIKMLNLKKVQL